MKKFVAICGAACLFLMNGQSDAQIQVRVDVTNNAPAGGVAITPLWVGFHDGSFDSYNGGLSSQPGLERIAEDGDTSQISADFLNDLTYIDTSGGPAVSATVASSQTGTRVDGTIASADAAPPDSGWRISKCIF